MFVVIDSLYYHFLISLSDNSNNILIPLDQRKLNYLYYTPIAMSVQVFIFLKRWKARITPVPPNPPQLGYI